MSRSNCTRKAARAAVCAILLATGEIGTMANAETWVMDDDPIPDDQVAATADLYHRDPTMGSGGSTRVVDAPVTFGIQHIYSPPLAPPGTAGAAPSGQGSDYYLVTIPFTLHPLSRDRGYRRVKLELRMNDPKVTAFKLIPDALQSQEDVKRGFDLSGSLKKAGVELEGSGSYSIAYRNLQPLLSSFGLGESSFYWVLEAQAGHPVDLGARKMLVLIEAPAGTAKVVGELRCEADIDSLFSWLGQQHVTTDPLPLSWSLQNAEPPSAIPWRAEDIANPMIR